MPDTNMTLAVDLGGTQMRAALVTPEGDVVQRRAEPTPQDATCPDALLSLVGDVLADGGAKTAVIGVPGRVNHRSGRLEHAPNLPPHWPDALQEDQLTERFGIPVALANDADLAATGEGRLGAGRGHADIVYLTISTGIGAGVLLDGHIVLGTRSLAETGHTVLDLTAHRRGQAASFEDLGSGTALERRAEEAGLPRDGARIVELVHQGHPDASRIWEELVTVIIAGVRNLAFLFSPSVVVLGGGVGRNGDLLIDPISTALQHHGPPDLPDPIEVVIAELGDDAALIGAAAWHEVRRGPGDG